MILNFKKIDQQTTVIAKQSSTMKKKLANS